MIPPGLHVVDRAGPGTLPVVLVHGAPDRSKNFAAVMALLDDLPLITYDRRGYGKSVEANPPAANFRDHAEDLVAILDGRRSVIVAQSVGCNVAMTTAALAPDLVASLGLWEPPNAWCDWWPVPDLRESAQTMAAATDTAALAEGFNRQILGESRWEALPERTRQLLRAEGWAFRNDMRAELTAPFEFEDIHAPTVVGYGTETVSGHAEGARRLAQILGADLYAVEGADHFAPMTNPRAWAALARKAVALAAPR